MLISYYVNDI